MRKVYAAKGSSAGLPVAVGLAAGLTALIFCILPFSHLVNNPSKTVELRKTSAADLPPPPPEETQMAPPEPESAKETAPEPQLAETAQQIPLSADLEVAAGSGGALAGFGEIRALTAVETVQQDVFDVADLQKRPEAVSQVAPTYPPELRKAKVEGLVTLAFVLSEDGKVEDPRVENSSRPEFEKPALEAIRKWHFRPGMKDGQAVRTYIRLPMRFRMAS
jgi:periplasmic protein TonB